MIMQTTSSTHLPRIVIEPGFEWDGQDAYLFDIDGTLLRSRDRIHFDSFTSSVNQVMGHAVSLADVAVHGSTDTKILRDACLQAGIPAAVLELRIGAILESMRTTVAERRDEMDLLLMPGVEETLSHLAQKGALLGVATGNLELIGWIKMEQAGLREWFKFGGFSDHFPIRSELVGQAAEQARKLAGSGITVCVVGDTPRDIEAAHANSLAVIAVATGNFSFDELLEHEPEVCASSLADLLAPRRTRP